jgi:hypothetical protein
MPCMPEESRCTKPPTLSRLSSDSRFDGRYLSLGGSRPPAATASGRGRRAHYVDLARALGRARPWMRRQSELPRNKSSVITIKVTGASIQFGPARVRAGNHSRVNSRYNEVSRMSSQLLSSNSEAAIWARLMQAQKDELSPEAAEFLLAIDFGDSDRERMLQLAERSEGGTLTAEEQIEFDGYLHVGNLLAVMQSKARRALKAKPRDRHHS